jgi:hypothetical protein
MSRLLTATVLTLAAACALPGAARAAETGSVSGVVFDQGALPVQGASVRIAGERLPAGRTTSTEANGQYRFTLLLPGTYELQIEKPGAGATKRTVLVEVGRDTQLDVVLGIDLQESVRVVAQTPEVDLRSTEVSFNYARETIEALPLARSYSGLFQLVPGVADNNSFAPSGGGSRQENTYLIDGVNITNPGFGYLSTEVNEFDILQFHVKRGAITAEFGRSSGFVTNAVTRSGSNRFTGGVRFEMIPRGWIAESRNPNVSNTTDQWIPAGGLGGPLLRDRIFFYASGRHYRSDTTDRVNRTGPLPDRTVRTSEVFGKITAQPTPSHQLVASYRHRPNRDRFAGIGVNDTPDVASHNEGTNRVGTAVWNWFAGPRTVLDVKYLHMDEENESVAVRDLGVRGAFDAANPAAMGFYSGPDGINRGAAELRLNRQNYSRDEVRATLTQFLDFGRSSHQVKAGVGFDEGSEDLTRLSNGWGSILLVQNNTQLRARYYPDQPAQLSPGRTWSVFLQDDITIGQRLVVNAGVLFNRDEFAQVLQERNTFLVFDFGDEIQPRFGVNYNLRKGSGDKVYGNYGRYFNLDQKSSSRSLAPGRLFTNDALFNRTTGALISDLPGANTTGKVLDAGMKPPYVDEVLVGYATPLGALWSIDAFWLYRDASAFIEDQPRILPASSFHVTNIPAAERKYRTVTLELNRRLQDDWSLNASYAWSRLEGNFDLDYVDGIGTSIAGTSSAAVFNTSSILEDGPGVFVEDRFRYGPLSQDRPHVLKLFFTYLPVRNVTLGTYLRAQSGTPFEARGRDWYDGFRRYLEPAGSSRNDTWTNLDLLAAYRVALGGRTGLRIETRVLNVFDRQAALARDKRLYLDGRIRYANAALPAGCDRACSTDFMVQGTTMPNPAFRQPTVYAPARRVLLTAVLDF